jgi:hypothetical protein
MVDATKPPPPTTDELLERIARLEKAFDDLQQQVNGIESDFLKEVEDATRHFSYLYQRLRDYLWPVVHKVFPRFSAVMEQSEAILKMRPPSEDTL